ncbi:MAG: hypothetical protein AB7V46_05285 [Thermomicrobiales bacterium]
MSSSLVAGYLPGIASEQQGAPMSRTSSVTSEWTSTMASITLRQHSAEDSVASAWVMVSTVVSCLVTMMAVVIAAATAMP